MKPSSFDYVAPNTLKDALLALQAGGDDARVIAGGQSLIPIMNFRLGAPERLIDLNGIPELGGIGAGEPGFIRIGAMTRHREVERSAFLVENLPILPVAMEYVAHVQIRNRGTIGGSLSHSDPSAEWPALCLALDAIMVVASPDGDRKVPAGEFSLGVMTTALGQGEILKEILFPVWPVRRRWGFTEISRRRGDFALIGVACIVDFGGDDTIDGARIAIFGAQDQPVLAEAAIAAIVGKRLDASIARQAGKAAAASISARADLHASADYRSQLIEVLVDRALQQTIS